MAQSTTGSLKTMLLHSEGTVCLAYSQDARYLYSSGSDCIRLLDTRDPLECLATIEYHTKPVTYLDCSPDYLVSCSESGETVLHKHGASSSQSATFVSILTRSSLSSRCVKFSRDCKKVAVCSDELTAKIIHVDDPLNCQLLVGHSKSPKSLSWSPTSDIIITSGCEGTLRIWNADSTSNGDEPKCFQTIENIIPSVLPEDFKTVEATWHPSGNLFVVPTRDQDLAIFQLDSHSRLWKKVQILRRHDTTANQLPDILHGHQSCFTSSNFSPNGSYLATGFEDGLVIVWNVKQWQYSCHCKSDLVACITSIRWKPDGNAIVIGDQQGQIIAWNDVISPDQDHPSLPVRAPIASVNRNSVSVRDRGSEFQTAHSRSHDFDTHGDGLDDDDWFIDDAHAPDNLPEFDTIGHISKHPQSRRPVRHHTRPDGDIRPLQRPFQSGATNLQRHSGPLGSQSRRYMAFNSIGLAYVLEKDTENIVTVEFHDQGKRPRYHFTDRFKFNLCSISESGVAFARGADETASGESVIRYDPYESWATEGLSFAQLGEVTSTTEGGWQYLLPRGENATCLGCGGSVKEDDEFGSDGLTGSGSVVVGTDKGYIRVFTGSGIQSYVWNLGQSIISLACNNEWLFVVHGGQGNHASRLQYTMMDIDTFEIVQEGNIPLSDDKTFLTWIGFTTQHQIPACFTSSGVLSFLDKARRPKQGRWVPVLDTENLQKSDGSSRRAYWPIGVTETQLSCIVLKGGETEPAFPTPVVQEVDLIMPFLRLNEHQGQLEESHLRGSLLFNHQSDLSRPEDSSTTSQLELLKIELDKQLLKAIQSCCSHSPTPQLQKALDYANSLKNINSLEAASKISKFFNLIGLYDRITKVKESKELHSTIDPGKRVSKYAHLEDYNIMSRSDLSVKERNAMSHKPSFDTPFDNSVSNTYSQGGGGLLSKGNVFKNPLPSRIVGNDDGAEDWQGDDTVGLMNDWTDEPSADDFMNPADVHVERDQDLGNPPKLSEHRLITQPAPQKGISTNPFAKKLVGQARQEGDFRMASSRSTSPSSTNPFSAKKTSLQSASLKRPATFFDRVEEADMAPGKLTKGKTRQSTLFGLPSKAPQTGIEKGKTGKKRKSENVQNDSVEGEPPKSKNIRPLSSFLAKSAAKPARESIESSKQTTSGPNSVVSEMLPNSPHVVGASSGEEKVTMESGDETPKAERESQVSLTSLDFSQSLPPRIRSTHPPPDSEHEN